jgi:hypothetical protein
MPAADLRVMDGLWKAASAGKFGFAAQREVSLTDGGRERGPAPAPLSCPVLTPTPTLFHPRLHPHPPPLSHSQVWLQNRKRWDRFFKQIDWVVGEDNNYRYGRKGKENGACVHSEEREKKKKKKKKSNRGDRPFCRTNPKLHPRKRPGELP